MGRFSKRNILYFPSMSGKTDLGGLTHQSEIIRSLSSKFNTYVVGNKTRLVNYQKVRDKSYYIKFLPRSTNKTQFVDTFFHFFRSIRNGLGISKKKRIDLFYVRHGIASIPALFIGKLSGAPVIIEVNGILADERNTFKEVDIVSKLLLMLDKISAGFAKKIIVVTQGLKDYFVDEHGISENEIFVVPNGADTQIFYPMNKDECKKELGLRLDINYIIFVGTLAPWQGLEYLIDAAPDIYSDRSNIEYIIVGGGSNEKKLKNQVEKLYMDKLFHFVGIKQLHKIPKYICSADLCVAPFITERNMRIGLSPLKIFEYAACGKPVIASRINGLEFIENEKIGVLVEPENSKALAHAIIQLINDEAQLASFNETSRALIESKYSWQLTGRKTIEICKSTIGAT